jgi:hypothetical protein
MNSNFASVKSMVLVTALAALGGARAVLAQPPATPPPHAHSAQEEAGEPRAATSAPASDPPAPLAMPAPAATPASPSAAAPSASTKTPPTTAPGSSKGRNTAAAAPPAGAKNTVDRLELGTATVTGDQEQPKVMYIVPWKKSDIGDLSGKPMNSLLDEALAPVDREEFKREVVYYEAVRAETSQSGAPHPPAKQGEK